MYESVTTAKQRIKDEKSVTAARQRIKEEKTVARRFFVTF